MKFGDYCFIEQKRYGCDYEMYRYKVIRELKSNHYVDVPVQIPAEEILHKDVVDVISCICCGVYEREVLNYKLSDVKSEDK